MAAAINDPRRREMDRFMSEILGIMKNPFPNCTSAQSCSVFSNIKKILEQFLCNSDDISNVQKLQAFTAAIKVYCLVCIRHPCCVKHSSCVSELLHRECAELLLQAEISEMAEDQITPPKPEPINPPTTESTDPPTTEPSPIPTPHPTWILFKKAVSEVNVHLNPAGSRTPAQPWIQRLVQLSNNLWSHNTLRTILTNEPVDNDTAISYLETEGAVVFKYRLYALVGSERYALSQRLIDLAQKSRLLSSNLKVFLLSARLICAYYLSQWNEFNTEILRLNSRIKRVNTTTTTCILSPLLPYFRCNQVSPDLSCSILAELLNKGFSSQCGLAVLYIAHLFFSRDWLKPCGDIAISQVLVRRWLTAQKDLQTNIEEFKQDLKNAVIAAPQTIQLVMILNEMFTMHGSSHADLCIDAFIKAIKAERRRLMWARLYHHNKEEMLSAADNIVILLGLVRKFYVNDNVIIKSTLLSVAYVAPTEGRIQEVRNFYCRLIKSGQFANNFDPKSPRAPLLELIDELRPAYIRIDIKIENLMQVLRLHMADESRLVCGSDSRMYGPTGPRTKLAALCRAGRPKNLKSKNAAGKSLLGKRKKIKQYEEDWEWTAETSERKKKSVGMKMREEWGDESASSEGEDSAGVQGEGPARKNSGASRTKMNNRGSKVKNEAYGKAAANLSNRSESCSKPEANQNQMAEIKSKVLRYKCPYCSRVYTSSVNVRRHLLKDHKEAFGPDDSGGQVDGEDGGCGEDGGDEDSTRQGEQEKSYDNGKVSKIKHSAGRNSQNSEVMEEEEEGELLNDNETEKTRHKKRIRRNSKSTSSKSSEINSQDEEKAESDSNDVETGARKKRRLSKTSSSKINSDESKSEMESGGKSKKLEYDPEKPYVCKICKKGFAKKIGLCCHVSAMHGEILYSDAREPSNMVDENNQSEDEDTSSRDSAELEDGEIPTEKTGNNSAARPKKHKDFAKSGEDFDEGMPTLHMQRSGKGLDGEMESMGEDGLPVLDAYGEMQGGHPAPFGLKKGQRNRSDYSGKSGRVKGRERDGIYDRNTDDLNANSNNSDNGNNYVRSNHSDSNADASNDVNDDNNASRCSFGSYNTDANYDDFSDFSELPEDENNGKMVRYRELMEKAKKFQPNVLLHRFESQSEMEGVEQEYSSGNEMEEPNDNDMNQTDGNGMMENVYETRESRRTSTINYSEAHSGRGNYRRARNGPRRRGRAPAMVLPAVDPNRSYGVFFMEVNGKKFAYSGPSGAPPMKATKSISEDALAQMMSRAGQTRTVESDRKFGINSLSSASLSSALVSQQASPGRSPVDHMGPISPQSSPSMGQIRHRISQFKPRNPQNRSGQMRAMYSQISPSRDEMRSRDPLISPSMDRIRPTGSRSRPRRNVTKTDLFQSDATSSGYLSSSQKRQRNRNNIEDEDTEFSHLRTNEKLEPIIKPNTLLPITSPPDSPTEMPSTFAVPSTTVQKEQGDSIISLLSATRFLLSDDIDYIPGPDINPSSPVMQEPEQEPQELEEGEVPCDDMDRYIAEDLGAELSDDGQLSDAMELSDSESEIVYDDRSSHKKKKSSKGKKASKKAKDSSEDSDWTPDRHSMKKGKKEKGSAPRRSTRNNNPRLDDVRSAPRSYNDNSDEEEEEEIIPVSKRKKSRNQKLTNTSARHLEGAFGSINPLAAPIKRSILVSPVSDEPIASPQVRQNKTSSNNDTVSGQSETNLNNDAVSTAGQSETNSNNDTVSSQQGQNVSSSQPVVVNVLPVPVVTAVPVLQAQPVIAVLNPGMVVSVTGPQTQVLSQNNSLSDSLDKETEQSTESVQSNSLYICSRCNKEYKKSRLGVKWGQNKPRLCPDCEERGEETSVQESGVNNDNECINECNVESGSKNKIQSNCSMHNDVTGVDDEIIENDEDDDENVTGDCDNEVTTKSNAFRNSLHGENSKGKKLKQCKSLHVNMAKNNMLVYSATKNSDESRCRKNSYDAMHESNTSICNTGHNSMENVIEIDENSRSEVGNVINGENDDSADFIGESERCATVIGTGELEDVLIHDVDDDDDDNNV